MSFSVEEKYQELYSDMKFDTKEKERDFKARKYAEFEMIGRLENKYQDRGFKFTVNFAGSYPVQAFGHLDGMRFYFRFRHNTGSLKVGPYLRDLEEILAMRIDEDNANRLKDLEARGELEDNMHLVRSCSRKTRVSEETDEDYFPQEWHKSSFAEGEDPDDEEKGSLSHEESFKIFSYLVDHLADIPADKRMNAHQRIWLYEGREAANTWWKKNIEDIASHIHEEVGNM